MLPVFQVVLLILNGDDLFFGPTVGKNAQSGVFSGFCFLGEGVGWIHQHLAGMSVVQECPLQQRFKVAAVLFIKQIFKYIANFKIRSRRAAIQPAGKHIQIQAKSLWGAAVILFPQLKLQVGQRGS